MKIRLLADCFGAQVHGRAGDVVRHPHDESAKLMIEHGAAMEVEDDVPEGAPATPREKKAAETAVSQAREIAARQRPRRAATAKPGETR